MPSEKSLKKKRKIIEYIKKLAKEYKVIGIVDFTNLPSRQLTDMRLKLRGKAKIFMTKKRIAKRAMEELDIKNIKELEKYLTGQPAFLFTNENPFKIFQYLKENQSKTFIKPGQIAPEDIIVRAGATNFTPGPIIGELGAFKIKTGVENGKVVIKEDVTVAKEGEVVDAKLASILQKLGIEPMKIGLQINAILEDGVIYEKKVLDISKEDILSNIRLASNESLLIAREIGYICKETIEPLIIEAYRNTKTLAQEINYISKDTIKEIIKKSEIAAQKIKSMEG